MNDKSQAVQQTTLLLFQKQDLNTLYLHTHSYHLLLYFSLFRGYKGLFFSTPAVVPQNLRRAAPLLSFFPPTPTFSLSFPTVFKH